MENFKVRQGISVSGNSGLFLPVGNTSQRPTGSNGVIRYNSETSKLESYVNILT